MGWQSRRRTWSPQIRSQILDIADHASFNVDDDNKLIVCSQNTNHKQSFQLLLGLLYPILLHALLKLVLNLRLGV
jgi:hypothetical protein